MATSLSYIFLDLIPKPGSELIKRITTNMPNTIKEGELIPSIRLSRLQPDGKTVTWFDTRKEFSKELTALFFVPGAWTPTCTKDHLPTIAKAQSAFTEMQVRIGCVGVNNRDTMHPWAMSQNADPSIMIPDYLGQLTWEMGLGMDKCEGAKEGEERHLGFVAKRACVVLYNGRVVDIKIEENAGVCTTKSSGQGLLDRMPAILEKIKAMKSQTNEEKENKTPQRSQEEKKTKRKVSSEDDK
ncbi:MAG: redoxin family protein [Chlamydiota bacterium]